MDVEQIPALVMVKPKKNRYAVYKNDMNDFKQIQKFVDEVTGGFVQFKQMRQALYIKGKDDL